MEEHCNILSKTRFLSWNITHFLTTGFLTGLGLVLDLVQTSLGTSTHSSVGSSLVTCLQVLCGSRVHCSTGASWTMVCTLSWHCSSPAVNPHPAGAHSVTGSLVHPVMGVNFLTAFLETSQTSPC